MDLKCQGKKKTKPTTKIPSKLPLPGGQREFPFSRPGLLQYCIPQDKKNGMQALWLTCYMDCTCLYRHQYHQMYQGRSANLWKDFYWFVPSGQITKFSFVKVLYLRKSTFRNSTESNKDAGCIRCRPTTQTKHILVLVWTMRDQSGSGLRCKPPSGPDSKAHM